MERPASFDSELMDDWSLWVLDNGLPTLPADLGRADSIPVARWVGPRWGAVFHINWWESNEPGEPDEPNCDIETFRRGNAGWEPANGSGGSNWYIPPLSRPDVPARYAGFGGTTCNSGDGWYCCALDGLAGVEAESVEVEDRSGVTRNQIDSPLGVVLVAIDGTKPATVRVLDSKGAALGIEHFEGDRTAPPLPVADSRSGMSLTPRYTTVGRLRNWLRRS